MNLTVQTDYAFRVLMFLAVRAPRAATIQEMSDHYGVSRGHLMVLVHRLGSLGMLATTRGRRGGVRLARPASEIRLGEVIQATEPDFDLAECFTGESDRCLISEPCKLRGILSEALSAWFDALNRYTVDDLVKRNPPLVHLLRTDEPAGGPSHTANA